MAETIDSLLIRLGLETDSKSFKEANSQFAGIRTGALALGTAIIGAGVGMVKMSDGIARSVDTLGKWSNAAGVSIRRAQQLTFALQQAGSANPESDMMGMYQNVEDMRKRAMRGEIGGWELIETGINLNSLMSMNNEEGLDFLMRGISDIADPERQRRALDEIGFSGVAQHGVMTNYEATQQAYRRSDELGQADAELIEKAAAYNGALGELKTSTDSLKNEIADHLLPRMTDWINALNGGIQEYKPAAANAAAILAGDGSSLEKLEAMSDDPEVSKALGDFWSWFKEWNKAIKYTLSAADAFDEYTKEQTGRTLGERFDRRVIGSTPDTPQTKAYQAVTEEVKTRQADLPQPELTPETEAHRQATEEIEARQVEFEDAAQAPTPQTEAYQAVTEDQASRSIKAASTGLSSDEMNYEPSASELIPQGSMSEWREGSKRLIHDELKYFDTLSSVPKFGGSSGSQRPSTVMNINVDARGTGDPMLTSERVRGVIRDEVGRMVNVSRDGIPNNVA